MTATMKKYRSRQGLSLLEVMLALAILGVSLAILGELVRTGLRSAGAARDLSTAQIFCESKVAEIVSGIELPETVTRVPLEDFPEWLYSIEVEQIDQQGLLDILVTVQKDIESSRRPIYFSLHRWMIDPEYELDLKAAAEEEATATEAPAEDTTTAEAAKEETTAEEEEESEEAE